MRVGLARDPVGEVRYAAGVQGSAPPGEARHREVEAPPEEVHRAHLAPVTAPELLEHAVGLDQRQEEPVGGFRIVRPVRPVLVEGGLVLDLVRLPMDPHLEAEGRQALEDLSIEVRDRLRLEGDALLGPVARLHAQNMLDEVEVDVDRSIAERYRRRTEAARRHVESDVPGVVDPGRSGEPDLPDDLGPPVERRAGVLPALVGDSRPGGVH